ncbi:MAG: restriction endonuclease subunit S [Bacteroidales bacterium]|nr:restriction endonuclease subunit S [Bacteroidales bacterium]
MNKDWKKYKIDEILSQTKNLIEIKPNETYKLLGLRLEGNGLFVREIKQGIEIRANQLNKIKKGDFIYSRLFAWKGAFDYVRDEFGGCFVSGEFPTFEINNSIIDIDFLYFYFNQSKIWKEVEQYCIGVTKASRNRFKEQFFLSLEIPLPPLAEQKRIVAKLQSVKQKINSIKQLREKQEREIIDIYNSKIDKCFQKTNKKIAISEVCYKPQYGYTASASLEKIGPKFLRITDIQKGEVNWESVPYCYCENPEKYYLQNNDILFARTGGTIGKSFLVNNIKHKSVFASYLIRLSSKSNILPEYLYEFFQTNSYWIQITDKQTGTGQPNLNGTKLSNLLIYYSEDLEVQKQILFEVKRIKKNFNLVLKNLYNSIMDFEELFPSLLNKAFKEVI